MRGAKDTGQEAGIVQIDFSAALTGSTISGDHLQALLRGSYRFFAVCSDSFSLVGYSMS